MNPSSVPSSSDPGATSAKRHSALFTGMVLQQANLAMMCLGKAPRPDTKQLTVDLEAAALFIDTLEMLEVRTRGNLSADEAEMLRETLTSLRIAFVEAADREASRGGRPASANSSGATSAPRSADIPSPADPEAALDDAEARKKFVKRY